jgi:hypothetical protein
VEEADTAVARALDDPHALLNAARAAFLHAGVDAAGALEHRAEALVQDAGWGGDHLLERRQHDPRTHPVELHELIVAWSPAGRRRTQMRSVRPCASR